MKLRFSAVLFSAAFILLAAGCNTENNDPTGTDLNGIDPNPFGTGSGTGTGFDGPGTNNGGWGDQNDIANQLDAGWENKLSWRFPTIYFAYDNDTLGQSQQQILKQVAQYLETNGSVGIIIEGNCDDRGTEEYNRALGERRALAVKNYLSNMGIGDDRFKTISYGEDQPAVQGSGEGAWSKNRRAELVPVKLR